MLHSNYPAGADNDPRAPWNIEETPLYRVITNLYIKTNGDECGFEVLITKDGDEIETFESHDINKNTLLERKETYYAENEKDAYKHYEYQIKLYDN